MIREERVTKVLNNFLQLQGYTDVIASFDKLADSYYAPGAEYGVVVLGGISNLDADKVFMNYCKELGLNIDISIETISFLHELGHHNTMDFLDDEELEESELVKMMLYLNAEESDESYMKYFTCPIEQAATIDAVDFCNHNPVIVKMFDTQLLNALYGA